MSKHRWTQNLGHFFLPLSKKCVTGKKGYGARFGYFNKLKGTERLQHIALVSSSDVGALEDMQQVLRKNRGNWIIEVASAAAWGYYEHR